MLIQKDKFVEILKSIVKLKELDYELYKITKKIDPMKNGMSFFTAEDQMIEMLKLLAEDTEDWISYWIYDCDMGNGKNSDSVRTQDDKTPIPLRTPEDVYECIIKY